MYLYNFLSFLGNDNFVYFKLLNDQLSLEGQLSPLRILEAEVEVENPDAPIQCLTMTEFNKEKTSP